MADEEVTVTLPENVILIKEPQIKSTKQICSGKDCNNESIFECTSCGNNICTQHARKIINRRNRIVCKWCGFKEQHDIAVEWEKFYNFCNIINKIIFCDTVIVYDYFGNKQFRLILFCIIFIIYSIFSIIYELQIKYTSSTPLKLMISGDFSILLNSIIVLIIISLNQSYMNLDKLIIKCCAGMLMIASILYFIAIIMDPSYKIYLVIACTVLFVGIDIMNKLLYILNAVRWRIVIFSMILIINGLIILIEYFQRNQVSSIIKWYECGWCLVLISCLLILLLISIGCKSNMSLINCIFGILLFIGSTIVLITGCYLNYLKTRPFSGNMSMICMYIITFIVTIIVIWDTQIVPGIIYRKQMKIIQNVEAEY